jgi:hypothetical protein
MSSKSVKSAAAADRPRTNVKHPVGIPWELNAPNLVPKQHRAEKDRMVSCLHRLSVRCLLNLTPLQARGRRLLKGSRAEKQSLWNEASRTAQH